jgi:hypothetical protein
MAQLKIVSYHPPGEIEENHEHFIMADNAADVRTWYSPHTVLDCYH